MNEEYETRNELYAAIVEENILRLRHGVKQGKSGGRHFTVVCFDDTCPYYISCSPHVVKSAPKGEFRWRINSNLSTTKHGPNCNSVPQLNTDTAVKTNAVRHFAGTKKRSNHTIKTLIGDIASETHISCSPSVARDAVKRVRDATVIGSSELIGIQSYMETFSTSNGGNNQVYIDETSDTFKGMFTMAAAMDRILLNVCKRYVSVDATHTYDDGQLCGKIYVMEAITCLNRIIPIAFTFDGNESNETWTRFLRQCVNQSSPEVGQYINHPLTVIAGDRHNGIINAIDEIAPHAARRADMHHIVSTNLSVRPYNLHSLAGVYLCAEAHTKAQHDEHFQKLLVDNPPAAAYLRDNVGVEHYAKYSFHERKLKLYGQHSGSQNVECENQRLKCRGVRCQKPLAAIIEIHNLQRDVILDHIEVANKLREMHPMPLVVPVVQSMLDDHRANCGQFFCRPEQPDDNFMVKLPNSLTSMRTVNWKEKSCACLRWQDTGVICIHGYALARSKGYLDDYSEFIAYAVDKCYLSSTFCNTFTDDIALHIPDPELIANDLLVAPPISKTKRQNRMKHGSERGKKLARVRPPRINVDTPTTDSTTLTDRGGGYDGDWIPIDGLTNSTVDDV